MGQTMIDLKDTDKAQELATKLANTAVELSDVSALFDRVAEEVLTIDKTVTLNEQVYRYLKEAAAALRNVVPGIEQIDEALKNAVASMQGFEELNDKNFLGNI